MTMEATYGNIKEQDNYLLPKGMNTTKTVPTENTSRRSTVLIRTRADENNPFSTATYKSQAVPDVQNGSLSHHRQASLQLQHNDDYVNTATCLPQEGESVQYFVLEKPPDYSGAH